MTINNSDSHHLTCVGIVVVQKSLHDIILVINVQDVEVVWACYLWGSVLVKIILIYFSHYRNNKNVFYQ